MQGNKDLKSGIIIFAIVLVVFSGLIATIAYQFGQDREGVLYETMYRENVMLKDQKRRAEYSIKKSNIPREWKEAFQQLGYNVVVDEDTTRTK